MLKLKTYNYVTHLGDFSFLYQFNLSNLEVLYILQGRQLLDWPFARKLSTNYAFLINDVRVEKNFKALLIKTIENFSDRAIRKILSFINKSLGRSHNIMVGA